MAENCGFLEKRRTRSRLLGTTDSGPAARCDGMGLVVVVDELLEGRPTDRDADATKADWEKTRLEIMAQLEHRLSNSWPPPGTPMQ